MTYQTSSRLQIYKMRTITNFYDYELLDASCGEKLERWKDIILIRPDPQIIWKTEKAHPLWKNAHARYIRSNAGGGHWEKYKNIQDVWSVKFKNLTFNLKPMGFKHTGLFPEQAVNWDFAINKLKNIDNANVLNLFGYTGAASLACAFAGAKVTHVDASKGMVLWAKDNAKASGLEDKPIRWLVDDCVKFVKREIRRQNKYQAIIMDPPSYGKGPSGEIWRLEDNIYELLELCEQLLADDAVFFILNSYTTGLSPSVMEYMMSSIISKKHGGKVTSDEIGIKVTQSKLVLPCGNTAIWQKTF